MAFKIGTERWGNIEVFPFDFDREVKVHIYDGFDRAYIFLRENDVRDLRDHLTQLLIEQGVEKPIQNP